MILAFNHIIAYLYVSIMYIYACASKKNLLCLHIKFNFFVFNFLNLFKKKPNKNINLIYLD